MHQRVAGIVCALALGAVSGAALAQAYPNKPIRMLSGFAPGGAVDIAARTMATSMSGELGQQMILEHRVGAGGTVAANAGAKAAPDGYTEIGRAHV